MAATKIKFQTVDEYVSTFPAPVRETLEKIRHTIKKAAPDAEEVISYQMPAYKYHGMLIYFAGFKQHYSLFIPQPSKVYESFKDELSAYEIHKSTIRFPGDKPFPLELLSKITQLLVKNKLENLKKKK
jgi:uncharacterized protein YdhG (YjbR/CyaY superfamily)